MRFLKTLGMTLVLCFIFGFFGGWMLFDFSDRYYVATAACAFIIAVIVSVFIAQDNKIEQLANPTRCFSAKVWSNRK